MVELDRFRLEAQCPRCDYPLEVEMIDVRLGSRIFCPNCKCQIYLQDKDASIHTARDQIQHALSDLTNVLRRFGK